MISPSSTARSATPPARSSTPSRRGSPAESNSARFTAASCAHTGRRPRRGRRDLGRDRAARVGPAAKWLGDEAAVPAPWSPTEARQSWQECRLPIPRDYGRPRSASPSTARPRPRSASRHRSSPPTTAEAPDVFVIVLDTARADVFTTFDPDASSRSSARRTRWRKTRWCSTICAHHRRGRATSVATLMTGLSPTRHQVFDRLHPLSPGSRPTLQGHLRSTATSPAWSTNPNILPIWGFARGFDMFATWASPTGKRTRPTRSASRRARAGQPGGEPRRGRPSTTSTSWIPHHPYLRARTDLRAMQKA